MKDKEKDKINKTLYLIRGIGIGLILSAGILYFNSNIFKAEKITDQEIVERAKDLGMTFYKDTINLDSNYEKNE